jgi:hypothetical protein
MIRQSLALLLASGLPLAPVAAGMPGSGTSEATAISESRSAPWPVAGSLKATLKDWARRAGWPAPQFLTDADWPVDIPGSIPGSLDDALRVLVQGFGHAASRPRVELTGNHVIVVSEIGAE